MAAPITFRHGGMRRVAEHFAILWLLWALTGPGSCGEISYVQGPSWGRPRSTHIETRASQSRPGRSYAESRQLTNDIKDAKSAEELVHLVVGAGNGPVFNKFHASCAYHRLATWKRRGQLPKSINRLGLPQLHARVEELIEEGQCDNRQLANVLWSIPYLRNEIPQVLDLVPPLVAQILIQSENMNAQDLSNVLWASANLKDEAPAVLDLVPATAMRVTLQAKDMIPQHLSNVLWASAKLKDDAPAVLDLVPALVSQIPAKAKDMIPQHLSNVLWASAKLKDDAPSVLDLVPAIAAQVPVTAKDMIPQHLSNVLWASATLKDDAPAVLDLVPVIAARVPLKAKDMIPQHLSNILRASANLKDYAPAVLDLVPAIVLQIPAKAKDMKPQEFANSLVALIDLQDQVPEVKSFLVDEGGSEVPFVRVAASRVANMAPKLSGSDLLVSVPAIIWACWKLGVRHEELLFAAAKRLGSEKNISFLGAWALCALSGSYELLDSAHQYRDFEDMLQAELTKRQFSPSDVGWSLEGPLEWARTSK